MGGAKRSRHSVPGEATAKAPGATEFRAPSTDAWYDVRLVVDREAEVIHVLYCNFPDEVDETYSADGFGSERELEDFRCRFRPASAQLQDGECGDLAVGAAVCASNDFGEDGLRFYDAIVESIESSKGQPKGCKSVCTCAFTIIWQHGPLIGKLSTKSIQDICIWQPRCQQDEALNYFLEIARKRIDGRSMSAEVDLGNKSFNATSSAMVKFLSSSNDAATSNSETPANANSDDAPKGKSKDPSLNISARKKLTKSCLPGSSMETNHRVSESREIIERRTLFGEAGHTFEDPSMSITSRKKKTDISATKMNCGDSVTRHSQQTTGKINHAKNIMLNAKSNSIGRTHLKESKSSSYQRIQRASSGDYYTIKIENVEQDVSAEVVMNFLHEQTSVWSQVEFSSGFLPNRCCGKVFVKSVERADKLLDFLLNPECIVMSTRGNPWLIKEDWFQKTEGPGFGCEKCAKVQQHKSKLRLVYNNSREYERAKKLQTLCYDFIERIEHLHQRFEADEKNILQWRG